MTFRFLTAVIRVGMSIMVSIYLIDFFRKKQNFRFVCLMFSFSVVFNIKKITAYPKDNNNNHRKHPTCSSQRSAVGRLPVSGNWRHGPHIGRRRRLAETSRRGAPAVPTRWCTDHELHARRRQRTDIDVVLHRPVLRSLHADRLRSRHRAVVRYRLRIQKTKDDQPGG